MLGKKITLQMVAVFGLGIVAYYSNFEAIGYSNQKVKAGIVTAKKSPTLGVLDEPSDLSSTLLVDSIISIIQNYYVDQERVDNNSILNLTLDSLKGNGYIDEVSREKGITKIKVGEVNYSFVQEEKISYNNLIAILVSVSSVLNVPEVKDHLQNQNNKINSKVTVVLNSLLIALDAHSRMLSQEAYKELKQGTEGTFGGLGVLVGVRDEMLTVIKPIPKSPAFKMGIKKDDKIVSINGVDTFGFNLDQLIEHMRGEPGSEVQLALLRDGEAEIKNLKLKREIIQVDSVTTQNIPIKNGNIALINIESFSSRTSNEVEQALNEHRKKWGKIDGVVLDLRSNPGGLLDQAVKVADLFVEKGVLVSTKGLRQEVEYATKGENETNFPLIALINSDSASASEIVVGALQDHNRAVVIGQPSFGKGSVQTVFELPGENAIKLTIARYYTPSGRTIQNIGIMPDIWLQPIYQLPQNESLLGFNRYRSENFLANHLSNKSKVTDKVVTSYMESQKGFYLLNAEAVNEESLINKDRDLELALNLLTKVHTTYGDVLPEGGQRASHWLALASEVITEKLTSWNKESEKFLDKKFDIDWEKSSKVISQQGLKLESLEFQKRSVESGRDIIINYKIKNYSNADISQASLFVMSDSYLFATKEFLIGKVRSNDTLTGTFKIAVPPYIEAGEQKLKFGLAVSGRPIETDLLLTSVKIEKRLMSTILSRVDMVEESGGVQSGVLENDENAYLRVELFNNSQVDANDVNVKVFNLAGTQVNIDSEVKVIKNLRAGQKQELKVKIKASQALKNEKLGFGVAIESSDLLSAVKDKITIKAMPTQRMSSKVIAH